MRRITDTLAALCLLTALLPLLAVVALAILCTSGRPVFFAQRRTGLHGRVFLLRKFRTMRAPRPCEDELASDAARLTALGRFLRATSLDELPTLWNVLAGDMSLIGPRPLLPQYLPLYTAEQMRRHDVKPGMTGWAQVHGRNAISWEERFRLDVWYVDHRSLGVDLKILALTLWRVAGRHGITATGHATMPPFTGSPAGAAAAPDRMLR